MPRVQRSPPPPNTADLKSLAPSNKSPLASNLYTAISEPELSTLSGSQERIKDIFVNANRRTKRRLGDGSFVEENESDNLLLLSEITKLFTDFESKQSRKFDCLKSTMDEISEQNSKIQSSVEFVTGKYDELLERLDSTERENSTLKKKISSLESKMDYLERSSRSAMLEINNLPTTVSECKESLLKNLCKIGSVINAPIKPSEVNNIYRLKAKKDSHTIGTVVVEFKSTTSKENVLKATRIYNKQGGDNKLSTASIELPGPPKPIYIAESLTSHSKHLYFLGRKLLKEGKCDSCWTSHGKIYIKKSAGSIPFCVYSESDLHKLVGTAL